MRKSHDLAIPNTYWVELLLDDGEKYGVPVDAYSEDEAFEAAWESAIEWSMKPADLDSITLENEGQPDYATAMGI